MADEASSGIDRGDTSDMPAGTDRQALDALVAAVGECSSREGVQVLDEVPDEVIVRVLESLNPAIAQDVLDDFSAERRHAILAAAPPELSRQWMRNQAYPEGSVGRLMDPPIAVFARRLTVRDTIEQLRRLVAKRFITYGYVVDDAGRLCGVLVMRDLLFADHAARIEDVMVRDPFWLRPEMPLLEAVRLVAPRQYPAYPVCDEHGRIVGVVRGQTLFEAEAFGISAQPGTMVGIYKEERLATPWAQSLKLRQPWLQLNLFTAFLAGAVVSTFQGTIDQIVLLAVFLPVLAGQAGNTGCQALAVTLRGMTLGDLKRDSGRYLLLKEGLLGLVNGALVGLTAAIAMVGLAVVQANPMALGLGLVVFAAMVGSCAVSGLFGAFVPLALKRLGTDPATASGIFVTTATDVASIGMLLGLAAWWLM